MVGGVELGLICGCREDLSLNRSGKECFMMRRVGGRLDILSFLVEWRVEGVTCVYGVD